MSPPADNPGADVPKKPRAVMQFHFTETCNLQCAGCQDWSQKPEQRLEVLRKIIDRTLPVFIGDWGSRVVVGLTGGEPFASPNLFPLLSYLQDNYSPADVEVRLFSNGTLLTEEAIGTIKSSFPIMKAFLISLDGVRQETHERIRGAGTYSKALRACELLARHDIPVMVRLVVNNINYEEAFSLTDLARDHGVRRIIVSRFVPGSRGRESRNLELKPQQVKELYTSLNRDADRLEASGDRLRIARRRCDWPVLYTPPDYAPEDLRQPFSKNGDNCAIGKHMITVMADGTALPCRYLPLPIGNVLTEGLQSIWNHPFLLKARLRHRYIQGKCRQCEFMLDKDLRFACGGGGALCVNYGRYGDAFRPDDDCVYEPGAIHRG